MVEVKKEKVKAIEVVVTIEEFERDFYKKNPTATKNSINRAYKKKHGSRK